MARVLGVIAAGGIGERFGGETPKQLLEVAGATVLGWALERLGTVCERIVVAVPENRIVDLRGASESASVRLVAGGATRWQSVRAGLSELAPETDDLVAVHDAARPAVAVADLERVVAAAGTSGAAVLGRPVADTLKRVEGEQIADTVDRTGLFRAETPQVFAWGLLSEAMVRADREGLEPTDESSLVERLDDVRVVAVAARYPNPKITVPGDIGVVRALLAARS